MITTNHIHVLEIQLVRVIIAKHLKHDTKNMRKKGKKKKKHTKIIMAKEIKLMNYIIKKMIVMIIAVIVMKLEMSLKNLKKQKIK